MSSTHAVEDDQVTSTHEYGRKLDEPRAVGFSNDLRTMGSAQTAGKQSLRPLDEFGINAENLAARRKFIRLTAREAKIMGGLVPWAKSVAKQVAKEFYDWQFAFPPTRKFFEQFAKRSIRISIGCARCWSPPRKSTS